MHVSSPLALVFLTFGFLTMITSCGGSSDDGSGRNPADINDNGSDDDAMGGDMDDPYSDHIDTPYNVVYEIDSNLTWECVDAGSRAVTACDCTEA